MTEYLETPQAMDGRDFTRLAKVSIAWLNAVPSTLIAVIARIGIAGVFWRSARTKVDGWQVKDSAIYLFEEENALPVTCHSPGGNGK